MTLFSKFNCSDRNHKDNNNIFSFIKDGFYSKIEELNENYQHFLHLIKTLKYHFYDNYYEESKENFKLVKRQQSKPKRDVYSNIILVR